MGHQVNIFSIYCVFSLHRIDHAMLIRNIAFIFQTAQFEEHYQRAAENSFFFVAFFRPKIKDTAGVVPLLYLYKSRWKIQSSVKPRDTPPLHPPFSIAGIQRRVRVWPRFRFLVRNSASYSFCSMIASERRTLFAIKLASTPFAGVKALSLSFKGYRI